MCIHRKTETFKHTHTHKTRTHTHTSTHTLTHTHAYAHTYAHTHTLTHTRTHTIHTHTNFHADTGQQLHAGKYKSPNSKRSNIKSKISWNLNPHSQLVMILLFSTKICGCKIQQYCVTLCKNLQHTRSLFSTRRM